MKRSRLEAFTDGVIAIIITIMVLELEPPHGTDWEDIQPLVSSLLTYVLSFVYVAIYWNNHHHMLHTAERVDGRILWANMHLLFWLSLVPFTTAWMGQDSFAELPTATYGGVLLSAAIAYTLLQKAIIARHGPGSTLRAAVGRDLKGKLSIALYASAILVAFAVPGIALGIYVLVALLWLVPDRRIESTLDALPRSPS